MSAGNLRACTNLGLFFTRLRPPRRLPLRLCLSASASAFAAATNCNLLQIRGQLGDRTKRGEDHFEPSLFGGRRGLVGSWNILFGAPSSS